VKAAIVASCSLIDALRSLVPGAPNRTLRQMLSHGRVRVNGETRKIADYSVKPGDMVEVGPKSLPITKEFDLEIIWEDPSLVVVHKPAGLLTVATLHERERTVQSLLRRHLKRHNLGQNAWVVHRLDKFVSGLLVFAKSEKVQQELKKLFARHSIERKYWAIVEGRIQEDRGTIRSRLVEEENMRVHSTGDETRGKLAITHYRVLRRFPNLTALEITLETGRKNQIRVHLAELKHPIAGDKAYGSRIDPLGRMALHAFCLGFVHPIEGSPRHFETDPPPEFLAYLPERQKTGPNR
jgi:23S rRNA pseudouridine1911/1915/1917 synthase